MSNISSMEPHRYRSIWISDVHLGFRGCRADFLLDFLRRTEATHLYLVGDIIDVWNMKKGVYWPQAHNDVIRAILDKAQNGCQVIYVPGNHDEVFRDHTGLDFGNVRIERRAMHETADGRRLLILHGDEFDSVVQCSRWLSVLGNHAYDWLLAANRYLNAVRRRFGMGYWSLAGYLKHKVKNAVNYISDFEEAVAAEAEREGADGLVCGHIHHAEIRTIGEALYCNCGDWVESCTALVERHDGTLELLYWAEEQETQPSSEASPAQAAA